MDAMGYWIEWSFREHHHRHPHCVSDAPHFVPSKYGGYFSCDQPVPLGEYNSVIRLVDPSFRHAREILDTTSDTVFRLLFYREGVAAFEHPCVVVDGQLRINAPLMKLGRKAHQISFRKSGLRVSPSIVCSSCDLHGWVEDGLWVPACPLGPAEIDIRDIELGDAELFDLLEEGWI